MRGRFLFVFGAILFSQTGGAETFVTMIHGAHWRHGMELLSESLDLSQYGPTTIEDDFLKSLDSIADRAEGESRAGRKIVLIGHSQGGFNAVDVARRLDKRGVPVDLLVTAASGGGAARLIAFLRGHHSPREIPTNVKTMLNYFSDKSNDGLGTDGELGKNYAYALDSSRTKVENIMYASGEGVDHFEIILCGLQDSRAVREKFCDRIKSELTKLN
jgi:pimeloyl-ACP methyl ester carboxylesterase